MTREEQKQQTRATILACARALFSDRGYASATTRDIAEACGISIGSVFAHFPNKQALLRAVLHDSVESSLAAARSRINDTTDAFTAMDRYAGALFGFYLAKRELSRELLREGLFNGSEFADQLRAFGDELVRRLCASGVAPARARVLAEAMFSHYFYVLIQALNDARSTPAGCRRKLRALNRTLQV